MMILGIRANIVAICLAFVTLALPSSAVAEAQKLEERAVGDWVLVAVANDSAGGAACMVSTINDHGEVLSIVAESPKHRWSVALTGKNLRLRQSLYGEYEVTSVIDGKEPQSSKAIPTSSTRFFIPLGTDVGGTEYLRRGSRIEFRTDDGRHAFSLKGSSAAIDALSVCAARHLGFKDDLTAAVPTHLTGGDVAANDTYSSIAVGDWVIDAMDDEERKFDSCSAHPRADDDDHLSFLMVRDRTWYMDVASKALDLELHQDREVRLTLDQAPVIVLSGKAYWPDKITVEIGARAAIVEKLRTGKRLKVEIGDHTLTYDLSGVSPALEAVERCVANHAPDENEIVAPAESAVPAEAVATESEAGEPLSPNTPKTDERREIGDWSLGASIDGPNGEATCLLSRFDELGPMLGIALQSSVEGVLITLSDPSWQFERDAFYEVSYVIDAEAPIKTVARANSAMTLVIVLGKTFTATQPLRHGSTIDFRAPDTIALFKLSGSSKALDALQDCADRYGIGTKVATGSSPIARSKPAAPALEAPPAPSSVADQIDGALAALREYPMGRVILEHDTRAAALLRADLEELGKSASGDKWEQAVTEKFGRFMHDHFFQAVQSARPEALATLVRHDRDVVQRLQSNSIACATFFSAISTGNLGILPEERRDAQVELYAEFMADTYQNPANGALLSVHELAQTLHDAYLAKGYSTDDIAAMDNLEKLDAKEICRLSTVYLTSVAGLDDAKAGNVYRSFMWGSLER